MLTTVLPVDFWQETVVVVVGIAARQACEVFLARPIATSTVGEGVEAAEASRDFNRDGVDAITVLVRHLVVTGVSEVASTRDVNTCWINVFHFHVHVEGNGERAVATAAAAGTFACVAAVEAEGVSYDGCIRNLEHTVGVRSAGQSAFHVSRIKGFVRSTVLEEVLVGHPFPRMWCTRRCYRHRHRSWESRPSRRKQRGDTPRRLRPARTCPRGT